MKSMLNQENQLVSEFFSNIGVAWFAAGVIGVFVSKNQSVSDIFLSFSWGLGLSMIFLFFGILFIRRKK